MRPAPVKQGPPEEPPLAKALSGPTATGIGFFTPDLTANTTLLRGRKNVPQAFRMDPPLDPRDTM
jgi:anaphase-promoting complex subunit 3